MKSKIFKILAAAVGVVLVLVLTVLPAFSTMVINVTVTYIGGSEGLALGFYYKTSDAESYTLYTEGTGPQASYSEFSAEGYLALTSQALGQGYTGFLLYLTEEESYGLSLNLVPNYLSEEHIVKLQNGVYYVASGDVFYFTKSTAQLYLAGVPVNYENYINNLSDYDYDSGFKAGQASQSKYIAELESLVATYQDMATVTGRELADTYVAGYNYAEDNHNYVTEVFTTTFDGFGSIVQTMFNLEVLGIKVYQICLLAAIIPLTIFLVRVCIHH